MSQSSFKFLGYRILKVSCEIKDDFFNNDNDSFQFDVNSSNIYHETNNRFSEVILKVFAKTEMDTFRFYIEMKGGFEGSGNMSDEAFKKFTEINGPTILYPFARAIITSYTAQANIPPLILPTVNFLSKYNEKQKPLEH